MKRHKVVYEYILRFSNSFFDPIINVSRMQRLLPKRPDYTDDYLERASHINVPLILKGVRSHQQKMGSVLLGGFAIPKKLVEQGKNQRQKNLEFLEREVNSFEIKYNTIIDVLDKVCNALEIKTNEENPEGEGEKATAS